MQPNTKSGMHGFSVLISLYSKEHPKYLKISLNSVFEQTLPPDEVVLVEDGPLTSELYRVLDEFEAVHPNMKRVPLSVNGGLGKALNEGLKHCSHDLVARMDTDDICYPDRFEKQVAFMGKYPELAASSAWLSEFEDEPSRIKDTKRIPSVPEEIAIYGKTRNPLNHPSAIFRKSIVEEVGGYMHFPLFEDWFLWARLLAAGCKLGNLPEPLVYFRTSPEMYKRRGGIKYATDSFRFQLELRKLGLITTTQAIKGGIMRGCVYLLPNSIREKIYRNFLRK